MVIDAGGAPALIAIRICEGLGEGTTFPALSALLAMWVPLRERSKLGSLVFSGSMVRLTLFLFLLIERCVKVEYISFYLDWNHLR